MSSNTLFMIELVIFNGVILVLAVREYLSARSDVNAKSDAAPGAASPEDPGHPER